EIWRARVYDGRKNRSMPKYTLSPKALNHIQNIWDFIAADNQDAADRIVDELFAAFETIG
ncbi:MAG TPA: type II toxin-antitoxin system RelE/ParE family toxin, partial [Candidatus Angelobacter sp.]|nr:type II toxin-antitoxin system RelE/ParE family toxin [Candidatus Angelobacter sp.]